MSLDEINSAVLQNNINLSGGKIEVNQNQYLLDQIINKIQV